MKWIVIEELVPSIMPAVANRRDKLSSKISLKRNNLNNSCSFDLVANSNVNRTLKSLPDSTMLAKSFMKLMCKDWKGNLKIE